MTLHGIPWRLVFVAVTIVSGTKTAWPQNVEQVLVADPSFDPYFEVHGAAVNALLATADGDLLVAGRFSRINGVPRPGLVRLDQTGAVDTSFDPGDIAGEIYGIAEQSDGKIVIVGEFYKVGGLPRRGIARLEADGSLDESFDPGEGISKPTFSIRVQPDGLLVTTTGSAGDYDGYELPNPIGLFPDGAVDFDFRFQRPAPTSSNRYVVDPLGRVYLTDNFLVRLLPDDTIDPAFSAEGPEFFRITDVAFNPDGTILVAGEAVGGGLIFVLLRADGSLVATLSPTSPDNTNTISAVAIGSDGSLVVGGYFDEFNGQPAAGLVRLKFDGSIIGTWDAMSPGEVQTAAQGSDETWLVGGRFDAVNRIPVGNIVRLTSGGEVDPTFDPGTGFDHQVEKIVPAPDGKWYVAGSFTALDGFPSAGIARLLTDGARDAAFMIGTGFDAAASDIAGLPDGRVIVAGGFSTYDGVATSHVTRLEIDGTRDASFDPSWISHSELTLALAADEKIYVTYSYSGPYSYLNPYTIWRVNSDGTGDWEFSDGSTSYGNPVSSMAALPDGSILVARKGGKFVRVLSNGDVDTSYDSAFVGSYDSAFAGGLSTFTVLNDGKAIVAGTNSIRVSSSRIDEISRLVRLNGDGSLDPAFPAVPSVSSMGDMVPQVVIPTADNGLFLAGSQLPAPRYIRHAQAVMRLRPVTAPAFLTMPRARTVSASRPTTLAVSTVAPEPVTYQWFRDGEAIEGATDATYTLPRPQMFQAGDYTVQVHYNGGSFTSDSAPVTVVEHPSPSAHLLNLSTRSYTSTGDQVSIPGFVIQGSAPKRLIIRALGPTLARFALEGLLPDPQFVVKRWTGATYVDVAANNFWADDPNVTEQRTLANALGALTILGPTRDAALLLELDPGMYTVVVDDATGASGVALAELYDGDGESSSADSRLVNISTRGMVRTGGEIMIPGFFISNKGTKKLLIRAVGPGLAKLGVSDFLANPVLTVFEKNTALFSNDNWSTDSNNAQRVSGAAHMVSAFSLSADSADAALVVTLPGGGYTVHVAGKDGGTGTALAEIYIIP